MKLDGTATLHIVVGEFAALDATEANEATSSNNWNSSAMAMA